MATRMRPWRRDETVLLRELAAARLSASEIAEQMDRPLDEIELRAAHEDVPLHRPACSTAPRMPTGEGWSQLGYAAHWNDRAEEARAMADGFTDPAAKGALLRIAESYHQLAEQAARLAKTNTWSV
jgi:hypothetical protein